MWVSSRWPKKPGELCLCVFTLGGRGPVLRTFCKMSSETESEPAREKTALELAALPTCVLVGLRMCVPRRPAVQSPGWTSAEDVPVPFALAPQPHCAGFIAERGVRGREGPPTLRQLQEGSVLALPRVLYSFLLVSCFVVLCLRISIFRLNRCA